MLPFVTENSRPNAEIWRVLNHAAQLFSEKTTNNTKGVESGRDWACLVKDFEK